MTHLDLFSGIGGFALAAQAAGYTTIGFSEIDEYATRILKQHWPDVPNYGDIRNVRGVHADLITGGFPCQPFSVAGKHGGSKDDRHLWPELCRVIAAAKPTWVICENVPGIINMELDSVLSDLESLGYATWPFVIPACAVGAQHKRSRVWIVAYSNSVGLERGKCGLRAERTNGHAPTGYLQPIQEPVWKRNSLPESSFCRRIDGIPNRTHRLRGLGNAIVPQIAEAFIRWTLEFTPCHSGSHPIKVP